MHSPTDYNVSCHLVLHALTDDETFRGLDRERLAGDPAHQKPAQNMILQ